MKPVSLVNANCYHRLHLINSNHWKYFLNQCNVTSVAHQSQRNRSSRSSTVCVHSSFFHWNHQQSPRSNGKTSALHSLFKPMAPFISNRNLSSSSNKTMAENTNLLMRYLQSKIKMGGPLTVAEYMKEVLTNSLSGYYMHRDVFGVAGDFITSPEISQMFGEMLGIWVVNEWMNLHSDKHIRIVELGPGRGTLVDDMLRVFSQFPSILKKISIDLVEVSPELSRLQAVKLTGCDTADASQKLDGTEADSSQKLGPYRHVQSKYGPEVSWYQSLADVPQGLSCFIAHEFFDALPIHKFHRTEHGWREVMVDVDLSNDSLRFVLAPRPTPASVAYLKDAVYGDQNNVEVCPTAGIIIQEICQRIHRSGGFGLLADYGHTGEKGGTFRAFKNHALHDPLVEPGTADLTADVNFTYLKKMAGSGVQVFGPIPQARFLSNMGIGLRLQVLLQQANQEEWSSLVSGYQMLMSPDKMGERFKFMCLMQPSSDSYTPAGFVDLEVPGVSSS